MRTSFYKRCNIFTLYTQIIGLRQFLYNSHKIIFCKLFEGILNKCKSFDILLIKEDNPDAVNTSHFYLKVCIKLWVANFCLIFVGMY